MKQTVGIATMFVAAGALAACDAEPDPRIQMEDETTVEAEVPNDPAAIDVLAEREDLSMFRDLLMQTNLGPALANARSMTLFAPNNDAFAALDEETMAALQDEANTAEVRRVLGIHLLRNSMPASDLMAQLEGGADAEAVMTTSNNYQLTAELNEDGEPVLVDGLGNQARLVETDIPAANGTVHIIDNVLLLPGLVPAEDEVAAED